MKKIVIILLAIMPGWMAGMAQSKIVATKAPEQEQVSTTQNRSETLPQQVLELQTENDQLKEEEDGLKKIPYDKISYALAVLVIALSGLFFVFNKKNRKKITLLKDRKGHYKTKSHLLEKEKNNLAYENEQLKNEIRQLHTKMNQIRQKQNDSDEQKPQQPEPPSLYADAIFDGKFNRVKELPDDDTIFELKLIGPNETLAKIVIYGPAYRRVIVNPSFLEGCEKQIVGNSTVVMELEGLTQKDDRNGKWTIVTTPKVKIC